VNHAHIEQYFRRISNVVEHLERLVELIVVVVRKGCDPRLDFLEDGISLLSPTVLESTLMLTCFRDIVSKLKNYDSQELAEGILRPQS
jgi:hypothetical protein